jgi:hypothetical protein
MSSATGYGTLARQIARELALATVGALLLAAILLTSTTGWPIASVVDADDARQHPPTGPDDVAACTQVLIRPVVPESHRCRATWLWWQRYLATFPRVPL